MLVALALAGGGSFVSACLAQEQKRVELPELQADYNKAIRAHDLANGQLTFTNTVIANIERQLKPLRDEVARLTSLYGDNDQRTATKYAEVRTKERELEEAKFTTRQPREVEAEAASRRTAIIAGWRYFQGLTNSAKILATMAGAETRVKQLESTLDESEQVLHHVSVLEQLPLIPPAPFVHREPDPDPYQIEFVIDDLATDAGKMDQLVRDMDSALVEKREAERHLSKISDVSAMVERVKPMIEDVRRRITEFQVVSDAARKRAEAERAEIERLRQVQQGQSRGNAPPPTK